MFPLQSVTYKIGKSCCFKYVVDNLAHDGIDCVVMNVQTGEQRM
jgi:hypothetical protein